MKKIIPITLALAAVLSISGCKKSAFDDKYEDPSKTTSVTCAKLFTGAMYKGRGYTFNAYWRQYTWENVFGKLAQTIGFSNNSGSMYYYNDGYAADRWNNFYEILTQYRVMQSVYEEETETEQENDAIFLYLTEVFLYDHLSQIVDLFGPVPFSEAGYLGITGDLATSYPAYDSDTDLYTKMLSRLDELYSLIADFEANGSSMSKTSLVSQDFLNKGDVSKWKNYCNSLMLRLGVHVSAQGSLTSAGRAAVAKAVQRSLITEYGDDIIANADYDGFKYWENFRDGFKDINNTASQPIINAMKVTGEDDPRLPIIYSYHQSDYFGMSTVETDDEQNSRGTYTDHSEMFYAHLDSVTYTANGLFKSPVMTAAEVNFLKAEAFQQGYASGNAKDAFIDGVVASVKFYFDENVNSDNTNMVAYGYRASETPSDSEIEEYAEKVWNAYDNKLEAIMTQKWLHFGIIQPTQAWTDIRRTGYPALYYPEDGKAATYKTIIQRIMYPNVEANNNTDNYKAAASNVDGDSAYYTLFWAKTLQSKGSYSNYLYEYDIPEGEDPAHK